MKKLVFITAEAGYLTDNDYLGEWKLIPLHEDFFVLELANYLIIAHECMDESYAQYTKTEIKHNDLAGWIDIAYEYCKTQPEEYNIDDTIVICHDKDVLNLKKEKGNSRIFYNAEALGSLRDKIRDGNIYIFRHSKLHDDMYNALIMKLFDADEGMVDNAVRIIKSKSDRS